MVFLGGGQNMGRGGAILTSNELVLTFRGFYVCANFGENRSRNASVRVVADGQTHRRSLSRRLGCGCVLFVLWFLSFLKVFSSSISSVISTTADTVFLVATAWFSVWIIPLTTGESGFIL